MRSILKGVILASASFLVCSTSMAATTSASSKNKTTKAEQKVGYYDSVTGHGITVTTTPFLGVRSVYNASDLLVNLPSMNEDLRLLQQQQKVEAALRTGGNAVPYEQRPMLLISGYAQGQGIWGQQFGGGAKSDINLSAAELDFNALSGQWASAFMALQYDSSSPTTGARTTNSRMHLDRAFVSIGDLKSSPVYGTVGQFFLPFGYYSSYMVTTPVTTTLFRAKTRAAMLGYSKNGLYAQTYAFKGDAHTGTSGNVVNEGGLNVGYDKTVNDNTNYTAGAGYITNVADSAGMQSNAITTTGQFQGFGQSSTTQRISHRVGGMDLHGKWTYGPYQLIGEFISALEKFATTDMTYNGKGATPRAVQLEGAYNWMLQEKPLTFALSYGHTWQALALNAPECSLAAIVSTSFWKDTIESIEFRHDNNYNSSDRATGAGQATAIAPAGNTQNIVTLSLAAYF